MEHILENKQLRVVISSLGAELQSVYSADTKLEYMWGGDPAVWGKHSPVLFPIIGTLKGNQYIFNQKAYTLGRHGFAREKEFIADRPSDIQLRFTLQADDATRAVYPFEFVFSLIYTLRGNALELRYEVTNPGSGELYFSVGGHPAFAMPLVEGTGYDDYWLEFNEEETKPRWPISAEGLIEKTPLPLLTATDRLPLSKALFAGDALVIKYPTSSILSLRSEKTTHGIDMHIGEFPFLGLWAAPNADFICIEPWCGIADAVDTDQELTHKEGIEKLQPGARFHRTWTARFY